MPTTACNWGSPASDFCLASRIYFSRKDNWRLELDLAGKAKNQGGAVLPIFYSLAGGRLHISSRSPGKRDTSRFEFTRTGSQEKSSSPCEAGLDHLRTHGFVCNCGIAGSAIWGCPSMCCAASSHMCALSSAVGRETRRLVRRVLSCHILGDFHQRWLAHTGRQIHHLQRDWMMM